MQLVLTPELILEAYRQGLFPMAYNGGSPFVHWVCPEKRGQLSIPAIHIPKSLKKTIRKGAYEIRINTTFESVIKACAEPQSHRPETWINPSILKVFCQLYERGYAHSVEYWEGGELKGGLYGMALGGIFFGESMFSRREDASKIALIHLIARLWKGGFTLLDTQFVNDHLKQFGVYEVPHADYIKQLKAALKIEADFMLPALSQNEILNEYLAFRAGQKN